MSEEKYELLVQFLEACGNIRGAIATTTFDPTLYNFEIFQLSKMEEAFKKLACNTN